MQRIPLTARLLLAACSVGFAGSAGAQHADFVLFGEPDPAAAAVPAQQQFVHPVTDPYFHENSFITSDVRAWYIYHDLPNAVLGGDVQVAALQLRLALTDTLQFVAYKDGYTWFDDTVINNEGFMDIGAGLKWNFYRDVESQVSLAAGVGYEFDFGDSRILQDDEELRLWFSADKGFDALHVGFTFNYFIPTGSEDSFGDAERLSWHIHADYYVCDWFSPVIEFNGYHTTDASSTATTPPTRARPRPSGSPASTWPTSAAGRTKTSSPWASAASSASRTPTWRSARPTSSRSPTTWTSTATASRSR